MRMNGLDGGDGGHGCARCAEFRQRKNRVFEHGLVLGGRTKGRARGDGEAPDADLHLGQARWDRCPACAVKAGISNPEVQGGRVP